MVVWIKCKCDYEWHTKSVEKRVTCPKCRGKVKNLSRKDLKRIIKNIIGI